MIAAAGTGFEQVMVGLALAIPSVLLGYLAYRRGVRSDRVVEQAGIATASTTSIGQVMDGLNAIISSLQGDNEVLRKGQAELRATIEEVEARLDVVEAGNYDLRQQNRELKHEIAVLHAENEALKAENVKLRARIDELEGARPTTD